MANIMEGIFVFRAEPNQTKSGFTQLYLGVTRTSLLIFFVRHRVHVIAANGFTRNDPNFRNCLAINFQYRYRSRLYHVGYNIRRQLTFHQAFHFNMIRLARRVRLTLNIPNGPFATVASFLRRQTSENGTFMDHQVVTLCSRGI